METIQIRWLRNGTEAMTFEKAVGDPEEAMELFNRLAAIVKAWWTRQAAEGEGG